MDASSVSWKNSVNATIGGVGMVIGPQALKALNSIEKIHPRMIVASLNGKPRASIISCYRPTNISEETELIAFYDELSSLGRTIPKHNILVIGGDMNAKIGKNGNHKYSLHNSSNRNGQHLMDFIRENRLTCVNANYQKREGKLWTYTCAIDDVFINKKWKNSAVNCEAYSSFMSEFSDHQIVTAKIRLSQRKNATRTTTTISYDWVLLNNNYIRDEYVIALRNKFDAQQEKKETRTANDEYENFVNAHLEAAAKYIPTKHRTKSRVLWETLAVREKCADVKTDSKCYRKNTTNANVLKLKKGTKWISKYIPKKTGRIHTKSDR